jgi:ethanolamine ammonia-lyase small subunit
MSGVPRDPWFKLAGRTPARIGLGRVGASLPTREVLAFALAHAQARDAVHAVLDRARLATDLAALGLASVEVESQAVDRQTYLRRPDLGRRLDAASYDQLKRLGGGCDLALIVGDGLSAAAVQAHAPVLLKAFQPCAAALGLTFGTVALAAGARVALGDEIGAALGARLAIVLIGERPGLSSPDSLGVYLTYQPKPGRNDAERNCISNVRPEGLAPAIAARKLAWLVEAALSRQLTGVALKDGSADALAGSESAPLLRG